MYAVMLSSCRKGQPAEGEGRCQGYKPVYIYNQALLSGEAALADIGANAERHSYQATPSLAHSCKFPTVACFIALETRHDGYLFNCLGSQRRVSHVRRVSFLLANLQFSTVVVFRVSLLEMRGANFPRWSITALSASKQPKSPKRHTAAVQPAWKLVCAAPPATD